MDASLRHVLRITNPWLADPPVFETETARFVPPRLILRRSSSRLATRLSETRRAHLVVGPRQAGKSTLVWSLLRAGTAPVLYLDCENARIRSWCGSAAEFVSDARELLVEGGVLFLDEAQRLDDAGLFIKGVVDRRPGWSIVVTGSSSFHLLARTRESLAGRATRHRLFALSLDEIDPPTSLVGADHLRRQPLLDRMLVLGSYPGVWTAADPVDELRELVEAFVMRDASDRFRIERPDAFRRLMHIVAGQVGDLVNLSEWATIVGLAGTTVASYLALLEETHVLKTIRPFVGGRRAELTSVPKVYYLDNGLRNVLVDGFGELEYRADRGKLLESWVFTELHKRWPGAGDVRYWRSKNGAEVDFILEPSPGRLIAIEVKASARPRLSRGARSFVAAYSPTDLLLVCRGEPGEDRLGNTTVRITPAERLPEVLASIGAAGGWAESSRRIAHDVRPHPTI